jgi:hypothetical protein
MPQGSDSKESKEHKEPSSRTGNNYHDTIREAKQLRE